MTGYLKRLISSLGAYQLADIMSKFMAILLLPVYTRYVDKAGYGTVEVLANSVILVSIVARFGMIEAFLRFHFAAADADRRDALARRAVGFLLIATTLVCVPLLIFNRPLSELVLGRRDATAFLIAVLGLWGFTNLELAYGLLRVEERLRAYATASLTNVTLTISGSLVLVVVAGDGAHGLLLANYAATTVVLLGVWFSMRRRLLVARAPAERFSVLLRFGLPTVPAEASVYALSVIDRYYIIHEGGRHGLGRAGLYSIAVKFAGAIAFIVRAFQYAWPPLAYSIEDDAAAGRLYGLITTYYALITGWIVAGLALLGRWVLRALTDYHTFGASNRALTWVSLGWAMYGLWVVFLVIAARVKVTKRNFTASLVGLAANVVLLVALFGPLGIAGAGIALCGSYLAMLSVMYFLTRSLFRVEFEWRRLAQLTAVFAGLALAGELLLPTHGAVGLVARFAVFLMMPAVLYGSGFAHVRELEQAGALIRRLRRGAAGPR